VWGGGEEPGFPFAGGRKVLEFEDFDFSGLRGRVEDYIVFYPAFEPRFRGFFTGRDVRFVCGEEQALQGGVAE